MRITKEKLAEIITLASDDMISNKDAYNIANMVLNIFGYNTEIADTMIDKNEREVFNFLLDLGVLELKTESLGKEYLIMVWGERYNTSELAYWSLNPKINIKTPIEEEEDIYNTLPEDAWIRKK